LSDKMNQLLPDSQGRTITSKVGLILGLAAFFAVFYAPALPQLADYPVEQLQQPIDHADVIEVTRAAQTTLALMLLMVIWWVTEAVPIPITALLPGLMLPLLHITGVDNGTLFPFTNKASFVAYANPVIYLFLAGFLLAGGMRKTGLDRRISLAILTLKPVTRSAGTILLSVMVTTAFLSMWISNTATTAMMLPIVLGILQQLNVKPGKSRFGCALMLGVAWSASIGGIGTIIGSPPNGIVVGILQDNGFGEISFFRWMQWGLPVAVVGVIAAWMVLMAFFRPSVTNVQEVRGTLDQQRQELGKWTVDQWWTLIVFVLVVTLWITQPFWDYLLPSRVFERISRFGIYEIGLLCALLLFIVPVDLRSWRTVMDWRDSKYVDWGTLILFGGGIALSNAMFKTGLTDWLAQGFITGLGRGSPWVYLILIAFLVDFLTEITSNTAVTTMMTPILILFAPKIGLDPLMLCVVSAMASSLAFMLPVATPPNALVYGTGYFRIPQMARAGFFMNLIGCLVMIACVYLVAHKMLGILSF
jgi:sodium-dependent dicarboxylate transporter 2/3/5